MSHILIHFRSNYDVPSWKQVEKLGIKYQFGFACIRVFMGYVFLNCENVPDLLPSNMSINDDDPRIFIGNGLGKEDGQAAYEKWKNKKQ